MSLLREEQSHLRYCVVKVLVAKIIHANPPYGFGIPPDHSCVVRVLESVPLGWGQMIKSPEENRWGRGVWELITCVVTVRNKFFIACPRKSKSVPFPQQQKNPSFVKSLVGY